MSTRLETVHFVPALVTLLRLLHIHRLPVLLLVGFLASLGNVLHLVEVTEPGRTKSFSVAFRKLFPKHYLQSEIQQRFEEPISRELLSKRHDNSINHLGTKRYQQKLVEQNRQFFGTLACFVRQVNQTRWQSSWNRNARAKVMSWYICTDQTSHNAR